MKKTVGAICVLMIPGCLFAQSISNGTDLQSILDQLYKDMMPLCRGLISSARLIGGFGALWYIGARVWKSIASAEPVDVYGLLRPFVLGFCILIFPSVVDLINGVMQPTVIATNALVKGQNSAIGEYLNMREHSSFGTGVLNPVNWVREAFRELLELLFQGVALIIDVIRTFYLIVLAIVGPIVFALAIFDGFQHLVTVWLARYINVYLWLPVANIFGAIIARIQERMAVPVTQDQTLLGTDLTITDWGYLIFLLIGIIGYCTVPSVTNYIVNAGGGNALLHKVSSVATSVVKKSVSAATGGGSSAGSGSTGGMSSDAFGNGASRMSQGMSENNITNDYFKDKLDGK